MRKIDWILLICWLCVLVFVILFVSYYTLDKVNSCTSDPLNYSVNKLKQTTNADYVYGSITLGLLNGYSKTESFGDYNILGSNYTVSLPPFKN